MARRGVLSLSAALSRKITRFSQKLLHHYHPSETTLLLITALLVGIGTGLATVVFIRLIARFEWLFFVYIRGGLSVWLGGLAVVLLPALGGLLAGFLIYKLAPETRGSGIPEVMEAIALRGGRIGPKVIVIKALATAACLGSGGSAGREGPMVHIGSTIGSVVGQMFHLSEERLRSLVACGAAAGIAAVFNTPIAGSLFAMEVILGEFSTAYFGSVVICAVSASVVSHQFLGDSLIFSVPTYDLISPWELFFYAILGLMAALVGWLFVSTLIKIDRMFKRWNLPDVLKPAVGGLVVGVIILVEFVTTGSFQIISDAWLYNTEPVTYNPIIFGSGLEFIENALQGEMAVGWQLFSLMMLAKILATGFTLGSGSSGGVFAPSLFIGATLGSAFGWPLHALFPEITGEPGAYALVGMAALFAAVTHAPITAIIHIFEISGGYELILPLMFATVISTLVSERLRPDDIYNLSLRSRGINLKAGRVVDIMRAVLVKDAMDQDVDPIPNTINLKALLATFKLYNRRSLVVTDAAGDLFGIVTMGDFNRALEQNLPVTTLIKDIVTTDVKVTYPDETTADALHHLEAKDIEWLPVVDRRHPKRVVGMIRRRNILKGYNMLLTDRAKIQHRMDQLRLHNIDNTEFVEIDVTPGSACLGKTLADLSKQMPDKAVMVSVRRVSGHVEIAHGSTRLLSGDRIVAFIYTDSKPDLYKSLLGQISDPSISTITKDN